MRASALLVILAVVSGCSAVKSAWLKPGYDATAGDAIKRIAVIAAGDPAHPDLDALMARVVADRLRLKSNYLVYAAGPFSEDWRGACTAVEGDAEWLLPASEAAPPPEGAEPPSTRPMQGVLRIWPQEVRMGAEVALHLMAELHHCDSGEAVWRVEGQEGNAAKDEDLEALTKSYIMNLGEKIRPYAAPAFLVLRDMLDTLPNPTLNDDEVMEKIELGSRSAPPWHLVSR